MAKGLPDVKQDVEVNLKGEGYKPIAEGARDAADAQDELAAAIDRAAARIPNAAKASEDLRVTVEQLNRAMREQRQAADMLGPGATLNEDVNDYVAAVQKARDTYAQLADVSRFQAERQKEIADTTREIAASYVAAKDSAKSAAIEIDNLAARTVTARRLVAAAAAEVNVAARAAEVGGAAIGGGGGRGFFAAMGPTGGGPDGFPAHTAGSMAGFVTGFVTRWWPAFHYAMMGAFETLSTVGPALVAAGAAGAVGAQGFELMTTRGQALRTVQEALGGTLHQTAAGYVGLKNNLQAAQNAANTGVWELAGAAINSLSGHTGGFTQMGTNTIAMLDRFGATLTLAFKGGAGGQLQQVVSQGTNYLKQFGDIAGNVVLTVAHLAPNLPGVGGDILSTLQGVSRLVANVTGPGGIPGPILGMGLAAEAGWRLGTPLVGLLGKGVFNIGKGVAGLGEKALAAGAGGVLGDLGLTGIRAGETLGAVGAGIGMIGAPEIAAMAAAAYGLYRLGTMQTAAQRQAGTMTGAVGQMGFSQAFGALPGDISTLAGQVSPAQAALNAAISGGKARREWQQGGTDVQQAAAQYSSGVKQLAGQFTNLLGAGQQISNLMGVDLPHAYMLADQAQLQMSTAFKSNGQLTDVAKQQLVNLKTGYDAMNTTSGVFGQNVGAVNVSLGLQHTQLATVNSAWDQFVNNAVGGVIATTGLNASLASIGATLAPVFNPLTAAQAAAGQTAKPAGISQIAQALTSFTSPKGIAAWQAFASTSTTTPGLLQQSQSMADWIRLAQTSGALTGPQGAGMTAFLAQQLLPFGAKSPLAASAVGMLGQQAGMPGGLDQQQQTAWLAKHSETQAQYNKNLLQAGIAMTNVSSQAAHFGQTMQSNVVSAMAQGVISLPKMSADMAKFAGSLTKGGGFDSGALKTVAADLKAVQVNGQSAAAIISNVLTAHGVSASGVAGVLKQVRQDMAAIPASKTAKVTATVTGADNISKIKSEMAALHDKTVRAQALADASKVTALKTVIEQLQGKTITVTTNVITRYITIGIPGITGLGSVRTVSPAGSLGSLGGHTMQTGGLVPGFGHGDHVPALLEPGEAIVPKWLVPLIAPILRSHHVPGFQAGGLAGHVMPPWVSPGMGFPAAPLPLPAAVQKILDQLLQVISKSDAWKQAAVSIIQGITYNLKDAHKLPAETAKIAHALTSKIATEMNYARGVSRATVSGLNLGGMDTTQTTVAGGMQSYLASIKSFTGDLKTLTKGGLSKDIMKQLIAAGPVQGDLLAQSIMQGGGTSGSGISQVNALWKQIGVASHGLGAQAGMSIYGGYLKPDLSGGRFSGGTPNVMINVNVPGGAKGDLNLTAAQIKALVEIIQAKLLEKAKRDHKTGLKLPGFAV